MSEDQRPSCLLRSLAIVLMALTVLFTLMGGIGTTCVAFGAEKYTSMLGLIPYKPLYKILVFVSIAAGLWGIQILIKLTRGGTKLYRNALLMLITGAATSGIQTAVSQAVRGSSAPANVRFAITLFTLVVFLLFRLPPLWHKLQFTRSMGNGAKDMGTGIASIMCGFITLSSYHWSASTHLAAWIDVIRLPLLVGGWTMAITGLFCFIRLLFSFKKQSILSKVRTF